MATRREERIKKRKHINNQIQGGGEWGGVDKWRESERTNGSRDDGGGGSDDKVEVKGGNGGRFSET